MCVRSYVYVCTCNLPCVHVHVRTYVRFQIFSSGQCLGNDSNVFAWDLDYSPALHGFSLVLSDGRAAFVSGKSVKYEPQVCEYSIYVRTYVHMFSESLTYVHVQTKKREKKVVYFTF